MHTFHKAVLVASMTALALSALAVPATAANGNSKGTLGIVNGMPGTRIDICVNGKEIKSRVAYGGRVSKVTSTGFKTIKVFKADPRTCRGTKIARKTYLLGYGGDFTIVVNRKAPRWVKFDNKNPEFLGSIWPVIAESPVTYVAVRHAADLGTVAIRASTEYAWFPSLEPVWVEGNEYTFPSPSPSPTTNYSFAAARLDQAGVIARSPVVYLKPSRRYEFILLGTKVSNAKMIVWKRFVTDTP
ncbi:MAG: hypothetical protein U9O18_02205 [Chloroflexota bacterium]|nr:hypothetical protein [Chloroflexota bacterium]